MKRKKSKQQVMFYTKTIKDFVEATGIRQERELLELLKIGYYGREFYFKLHNLWLE